jgi:hypothetical protein
MRGQERERLIPMTYSESKTPELKISLAMTVPNGLKGISGFEGVSVELDLPWGIGVRANHLFGIYLKEQLASLVSGSLSGVRSSDVLLVWLLPSKLIKALILKRYFVEESKTGRDELTCGLQDAVWKIDETHPGAILLHY